MLGSGEGSTLCLETRPHFRHTWVPGLDLHWASQTILGWLQGPEGGHLPWPGSVMFGRNRSWAVLAASLPRGQDSGRGEECRPPHTPLATAVLLVGAGKGRQMFHCSLKPCSISMKLQSHMWLEMAFCSWHTELNAKFCEFGCKCRGSAGLLRTPRLGAAVTPWSCSLVFPGGPPHLWSYCELLKLWLLCWFWLFKFHIFDYWGLLGAGSRLRSGV